MARGQLYVSGDVAQVQALGEELGPHGAALAPLVHALAFGEEAAEVVRWVKDSEVRRGRRHMVV